MAETHIVKSPSTPLGTVKLTSRGFEIIMFRDRYETSCSIQQSSIADYAPPGSTALWLGVDKQEDKHDGMFDAANQTRMHLDLDQVKALIVVLQNWVDSTSLTGVDQHG